MPSPLKPGDVLAGRYRIERVLGEGGMGVVLAAEHLVLGERVAVKLLLPEAAKIEGVVARFQREARAASRVQSEHVARVMDVGMIDEATPYLVMEYVEGRDLSAELEARGPLPIEEAVGYVLQAMVGVAEAHALGIVHRDLKPSNLFLARLPNGRQLVKVLDFGIAKDVNEDKKDLTSTFSALGSAAYMSPEQLRMAKSVDARTDVWAFGVVLFELLTSRMPFEGESVTALAAAISVDPPTRLRAFRADAPAALEAVILSCLEKNRDQRTASLADLARALSPFGGRYASVLSARIVEASSSGEAVAPASIAATVYTGPDPAASAEAPARSLHAEARTDVGLTRPSSIDAGSRKASPVPRRILLALALGGVGIASVVGIAFLAFSKRSPPESLPAAAAGSNAQVVEPAPPVSPAPSATTSAEHAKALSSAVPSAEPIVEPARDAVRPTKPTPPTRVERPGSSARKPPSKSPPKKPIVKDL